MSEPSLDELLAASDVCQRWPAMVDTIRGLAEQNEAPSACKVFKQLDEQHEQFGPGVKSVDDRLRSLNRAGDPIQIGTSSVATAHCTALVLVEQLLRQAAQPRGQRSRFESVFIERQWPLFREAVGGFPRFDVRTLSVRIVRERLVLAEPLQAQEAEKRRGRPVIRKELFEFDRKLRECDPGLTAFEVSEKWNDLHPQDVVDARSVLNARRTHGA